MMLYGKANSGLCSVKHHKIAYLVDIFCMVHILFYIDRSSEESVAVIVDE